MDIKNKLIHKENVKDLKYFKKSFLGSSPGITHPSLFTLPLIEFNIPPANKKGRKINKCMEYMGFWLCLERFRCLSGVGMRKEFCFCARRHMGMNGTP